MQNKRRHAIIYGRVQGVFFRDYTEQQARKLILSGWVRNLPDSTVETVFEGESGAVEKMTAWLSTGSPMSSVSKVVVTDEEPTGEFKDFTVRY